MAAPCHPIAQRSRPNPTQPEALGCRAGSSHLPQLQERPGRQLETCRPARQRRRRGSRRAMLFAAGWNHRTDPRRRRLESDTAPLSVGTRHPRRAIPSAAMGHTSRERRHLPLLRPRTTHRSKHPGIRRPPRWVHRPRSHPRMRRDPHRRPHIQPSQSKQLTMTLCASGPRIRRFL